MNIEELNNCFDSMTPTKEQKDRIFAGVMNAKNQPVKVVKLNRYKYASAAAAVVAVGIFAAVYSGMGTKDIAPKITAPDVATDNAVNNVAVNNIKEDTSKASYTVNEKNVEAPVSDANPEETAADGKSITEQFAEAYPELATGNGGESTVAVINEDGEKLRTAPAPSVTETPLPAEASVAEDTEELEAYSDELPSSKETDAMTDSADSEDITVYDKNHSGVVYGGGGGGSASGGGGGGGSSAVSESLVVGINDVMNHSVYGTLMPVIYPDKFNFHTATEQNGRLKVIFKNGQGNYMTVSIAKDGEYIFYEQVISAEDIKNMVSNGYMNFAVKCGEYYVIYNVETYNASAVYDMVKSSAYFNN